ncbi:MAG: SDR family NAD(P)-dependent oxidoreductase [candidate division Zixibacteria bacterium]|nr:SDR family NAD(P)-dependent oxidoreductase [candidate division Zixibacteria bacterium]
MNNHPNALVVGNSDGIGLGLTYRLLGLGWHVHGISRSTSPVSHECYTHTVTDVLAADFTPALTRVCATAPDLCVYCVGIGEQFDTGNMSQETHIMQVNLMAAMAVLEVVVPAMVDRRRGHIIVLTSIADDLISAEAPSYSASKAGLTSYTEGLALALRPRGVAVTNLRFGFVDTKMAKGDRKPFMMTVDRAVEHLLTCIEKRPIRFTRPRVMGCIVAAVRCLTRIRMRFMRG